MVFALAKFFFSPFGMGVALTVAFVVLIGGLTAVFIIGLDKLIGYAIIIIALVAFVQFVQNKKLNTTTAAILGVFVLIGLALAVLPGVQLGFASVTLQSIGAGG